MESKEWSRFRFNPQLGLGLYQAVCISNGFPLHMHDYYVFCLIERGLQSFIHRKEKHLTPPGGLILLNPGDDHTGEPADEYGFEYRALYPTTVHMEDALLELTGKPSSAPHFRSLRVDDPELSDWVRVLHSSLSVDDPPMKLETLFLTLLIKTIRKHAEKIPFPDAPGRERKAVLRARDYIRENAAEGITLTDLADHVGLSRYYLLRVFHREIGMPPYAYLESVRIGNAKELLEKGLPLNRVAHESGYSDQSHFTNQFKRYVGVTPGQYAQEIRD